MSLSAFRQDSLPPKRPHRDKPSLDLDMARARARHAWEKGESLAKAGDVAGGLAWMGRARRMAPDDQNLCFAFAALLLRAGAASEAASLFETMARRHNVRECWTGLAAASLQAGQIHRAREAAQNALSRHAVDPTLAEIARCVTRAASLAGWCGVSDRGAVLVEAPGQSVAACLDGRPIPLDECDGLMEGPRQERRLSVAVGTQALLGSPVALDGLRRVEGFVARTGDGVAGWAWTPAAPDRDPVLSVAVFPPGGELQRHTITATSSMPVEGTAPLARPRAFAFSTAANCEIHVTGADGRHLLGSPLPATDPPRPAPRDRPAFAAEPELPVDVVIPVYRGEAATLACLDNLMRTVRAPHRIVVVDDASPEPGLVAALDRRAEAGAIVLLRPGAPGGFPRAVNVGMRGAVGRHVVLLNSDTLVPAGWLETLRSAACSAHDIGTATPLSNQASIFSVPDPAGGNLAPDAAGTQALAGLAARANAGRLVDVPTAHGFCMFIRRDCLAATGLFEDGLFAQGYGEENDFCERARGLGYRHVAVPQLYVAHHGGLSFGGAGRDLLRRNLALLEQRHPAYAARVAAFIAEDRLFPARRRLDAARWRVRPGHELGSVLLVTHGGGGGTARVVAERAAAVRAEGLQPVVLRAQDGACEVGDEARAYPNLAYVLPQEAGALRRLLAQSRPVRAELHHMLGHDHSLLGVLSDLGTPYSVWVHDYAWFCARLSFVTAAGQFCGEAAPAVCELCLAEGGRSLEDPIGPTDLRLRSAADLGAARHVIVPSGDVARRVRRHAPGASVQIVSWEAAPAFRPATVLPGIGRRRVAVVGAIGLEKGFYTLLACARDAAARDLALEFVVVGYTSDDATLLDTGRAFVTGEFQPHETPGLIAAQRAHLAFLPSVWPETWCYALSDVWRAGLSAAVFDIGTPALRVRDSGGGWVLPLGLPAHRINDVLLGLPPTSPG